MQETVKDRLLQYIDNSGLSIRAFEKAAGLSNGYINNLKECPTQKMINRILEAFPDINSVWLLSGSIENVEESSLTCSDGSIRYWQDVTATAGGAISFDDFETTYTCLRIPIQSFSDCTDAVGLYGDSMYPLYKSGEIIVLKEWNEGFIQYGEVFLIVTSAGNRMVKYLRKCSDEARVLCCSENPAYDAFEIERADILRLYLVKGTIRRNAL